MRADLENLASKILSNEIYGNELMSAMGNLEYNDMFESQSIALLRQFMESRYLVLTSKKKDIATKRLAFARKLYEKHILSITPYYTEDLVIQVEKLLEDTERKFSLREF